MERISDLSSPLYSDTNNIRDQIDYLEREYRDRERGNPRELFISISDYAKLREELNVDILDSFDTYHGYFINVIDNDDQELEFI